uniref:Type I polyketide synthase n=1 Tax=Gambierdiscus excentricus TaxID=986170 RepID=A0A1S6K832_9DINO|nr:type I polyketide synthase [Gambierdiscus excentricus]
MACLASGALVRISGLPGSEFAGIDGQRAQLVRFERDLRKWIAVTFTGITCSVDPQFLRVLEARELEPYDFVFGPKTDLGLLASGIAQALQGDGYAVVRMFVTAGDAAAMLSVAKELEVDDCFGRMALEFERGYLGIDGYAKALLMDPCSQAAPDTVRTSPLSAVDSSFATLCELLAPHTENALGFRIFSRSRLLLQMPLTDSDDERYPSADIEDGDAEGYMQTMVRKKITLMQFVGPSSGKLKLVPRAEEQRPAIELTTEPHMLLVFADSRFEHSLDVKGESLTLSSFLMTEPPNFTFTSSPEGDMEVLGVLGTGPSPPPPEQCVIDGMYCRYGTGAEGRDQFWSGVGKAATDGLTEVPLVRFDMNQYYDPDAIFGGSYTKHGCFGIEGIQLFDNRFFEISPAEAKGMDPCQRQVMEVSYMALCEGGWDKRSLQRNSQNIGHFAGIDKDDWMCMCSSGLIDLSGAHGAAAAANAITSNRFAYALNLKGASMTIDTACSSSLVCTHVSKLHLRFKEGEEMPASIVNGLNCMLYQGPFVGCCAAGMLSHIGRSLTFNASADGYARGELSGALIFKLKNYQTESEGVLACLAGSQANQDGRSASLSAPNGPAQEKCINAVLKECALTPTEVDCFECHGTGTSLGDPIEVGAFRKVMSYTPRLEPMVITSSKSNIAHGEGGAGLAGFFKCCMQVMHCEGAANVHLRTKNPHLDMEGFPCQMLAEVVTMREDSAYSGVSSFGFGGTNAHAEAWGSNIMTSRGGRLLDPQAAFQRKLAKAPPAEITINGDNVEEWETTGPDPRAEPGTCWRVELDEDGEIVWERDDDNDLRWFGDEFFLRGTHNDWRPEPMERDDVILGLWIGQVTLGPTGVEEFQVVADNNLDMVYHPEVSRCESKLAVVKGPDDAGKDLTWAIRGKEGDVFRIEFFQQDSFTSTLWLKQRK